MKEIVNVNLASRPFAIDRDAYERLEEWLAAVQRHLPADDRETMEEIEARIAELLEEKLSSPMLVVTIEMVHEVTARLGRPSDFGELRGETAEERKPRELTRSRNDRAIAGVCAGIAEFFGWETALVRLIALLLFLFGGLSLWVYVILWILLPQAPARKQNSKHNL